MVIINDNNYTETDAIENNSIIPINIIEECLHVSNNLRDNITSLFKKLGNYFIGSVTDIINFRKIMKPYIDYFFSQEDKIETFINSVVIPNMDEMNLAIEKTVHNMKSDKDINKNVIDAIEKALSLQTGIDNILNIVEDIELYFLNTMMVSIKVGTEGQTLTQLSKEMGKLSSSINSVSNEFRNEFKDLNTHCFKFNQVRERIEIIHDKYLAEMKITTRMVFNEIIDDIKNISEEVNNIILNADEVESSVKNIIKRLQMEDVMQQNAEKIIFLIEDIINRGDNFYAGIKEHISREDFDNSLLCLLKNKIINISHSIHALNEDINECMIMIKNITKLIVYRFSNDKTIEYNEDLFQINLEEVYTNVEKMRNEFIKNIEDIIDGKKKLYEFSQDIQKVVIKFNDFFNIISAIEKKFEIINLLTRIELARSSTILKTVGGALTEISKLPKLIKHGVNESLSLYKSTRDIIELSVKEYFETFVKQESILQECIDSMKNMSTNLYKSHKYYIDISNGIRDKATDSFNFLETLHEKHLKLIETEEMIDTICKKIEGISHENSSNDIESYSNSLKIIKEHIGNISQKGDYRVLMIQSLIEEYLDINNGESITFF